MAKWKKIITAGGIVREAIYPAINSREPQRARAGKHRLSSEAQRHLNDKYAYQRLEMQLAANYRPGDLIVTLTYRDGREPQSRKEAEARVKYFRAKLSKARRRRRKTLVMFWATEHKHGDGRWHHHCVINATGDDYRELLVLWGQGEIDVRALRVTRELNYETQARYMTKESRDDGRDKPGLRSYSYTRNARKPEVETFRVDDDTTLQAPRGSLVFAESSERTELGAYRYLKYYVSGGRAPRSRRRSKQAKR